MKQPKVIYEGLIIRGTLPSGAGQDLLTINPLTGQLGSISGTPLTATLSSGQIFVGNASNVATAVNVTGDISISNTGVTSIVAGSIVNADINATASIAFSKMAVQTASRLLGTDGSGFVTVLTPTTTEANYLSGVTSAIQTQLNAKQATITGGATTIASADLAVSRALVSDASGKVVVSATTSTQIGYLSTLTSNVQTQLNEKLTASPGVVAEGDILYYNGTIWTNLPRGTVGQTLTATASSIQWSSIVGNGLPSGGTTSQYLRKDSNTDYDVVWDTLDLSKITDVTATAADVNVMAGAASAGITPTIIGYLANVSSDIQTQLNSKRDNDLPQNAIWRGNGSNQAEAYAAGAEGYALMIVAGVPTWAAPTPPGNVSGVAPSTDNALVRWNGTAADSIQNSGIIISDSNNMLFPTAGSIDTSTSNGNTFLLRAYNTGGASYTTMATMTAGATPTLDFNTGTTIGSAYIYRAGGTDVAVADGGTNISSYAVGDILYASGATTLAKLPVSTNGYVLTLDTGLPVWAPPSGGGGATLTATYVGFGDGANTLTGSSSLTFEPSTRLSVPLINYFNRGSDPGIPVEGDLFYRSDIFDLRARIDDEFINLTRPEIIIDSTTSRTLTKSDRNKIIYFTNSGTVTVTGDSTMLTGFSVTLVKSGTGNVVFDPDGVTYEGIDDTISTQYGWATFVKQSATVWTGTGALGATGGGGTVTSVTGTTNRITISGTATDPIVDIAATYVGQSSITTLGTIGTGVWQGTTIGVTYGGTGANLSATGGAGQYVKQVSTGAAFTVGTIPASDIASGAALTKVDDTNVTLTLGGTPSTALLAATSLTLGWSGQLAVTRGGTGINSVAQGDLLYGSASNVISVLSKNTSATRYLSNTGTNNDPAWTQINLANGVTGTLPIANGGTGSTAGAWLLSGTSTLSGVATITSNDNAQHIFNGTWTATTNDEYHWLMNPSITARATASDTVFGIAIRPTLVAAANSQTLTTLDLTSTYTAGAFSNVASVAIKANGRIDITADQAIKFILQNSGTGTGMNFYQTTTLGASITMTGSTASTPNALYLRTDRALGNIVFATASNVVAMTISNTQKVGIGPTSLTPTAWLHLQAGTATANTAPLKLSSGTINTTPEPGAVEYNGAWHVTKVNDIRFRLGGVLNTDNTTTANVGTGEDTLFSYTVAANTLSTDGQTLIARATGRMGASGSTKRVRVRFGSTVLFDSTALSDISGSEWHLFIEITRTGAATQKAVATWISSNSALTSSIDYTTPTETLSGSVTLSITGEATSNNEVLGDMFKVKFEEA